MTKRWRLAYLVSHPIQYQAPLLRRIAVDPEIDLTVYFCSDLSLRGYQDEGFGRSVKWDVPLLDGYRHEFLPAIGDTEDQTFLRPLNYGIARRLKEGKYDALWIHGWGHWSHWWAACVARRCGTKVFVRGESGPHLTVPRGIKGFIKRIFLRALVRQVDGFLAIGSLNREFYLNHGVAPSRIFMVPYAVDNGFFQERAREACDARERLRTSLELDPGRPVFLFAGKFIPRKRPLELLQAFIRLSPDGRAEPPAYLLYVGDGELRSQLEREVAKLGWQCVRLLGFKNQTELPAFYDLCDVFVIPSDQEPWGLVVNEVMNAGRAVIATDEIGAAPDLIKHSDNGFVYRAGDVPALTACLQRVVSDAAAVREMGRRSLERVSSWDFNADVVGIKEALSAVTVK